MNVAMNHLTSRRGFLRGSATLAATLPLPGRWLLGQAAPVNAVVAQGRATGATAKITTKPLRGSVSALMGAGGNIAVLPGKQGKLLIDSGYATSQPQITEALSALSGDPLTHLINTHWHYDHTDGNEWMHSVGATIMAQENTKKRLSTTQVMAAFHAEFPPAPAGAIPTMTFTERHTLKLNGETVLLTHYEPAHTDSDISIYFTNADVLHTGDTWSNGLYPFIDYSTGGSIDGMIRAAEKNLSFAQAKTMIIPGHGPVGDRAQLSEYHEVLVTVRGNIAALKKQGRSLDEVIAAKPNAAYDAKWGTGFTKPELFASLVYQGV